MKFIRLTRDINTNNDNGKWHIFFIVYLVTLITLYYYYYKYVCITTNQSDTKSHPNTNPNPTT